MTTKKGGLSIHAHIQNIQAMFHLSLDKETIRRIVFRKFEGDFFDLYTVSHLWNDSLFKRIDKLQW